MNMIELQDWFASLSAPVPPTDDEAATIRAIVAAQDEADNCTRADLLAMLLGGVA